MANRVLTIVAKVKDAASASLDKISGNLKKTGNAAKQTGMNFTEFNRVMFSTTAYLGFFTKSFRTFGEVLSKGAEFDRITNQFERVMGPKGDLFKSISGFTDNSIDKIEALRSAIQLKTLGIANSTSDAAELIARAGTAGKMAGLDSAEGIKKFTQFLKDGSVANLEFLNLIRSNDPGLKLQMSLLGKMGGVLGGAMTAQMKYNMGLRLLRTATNGSMKGQRDLNDVILDSKQSINLLKNELGIFLGTALSSLIEKVTKVVDKFSTMLEYIRENKKEVLFLVKAILAMSGAFAGLMASVGTIRLLSLGLKALGISTSPIIMGVTALIGLFSALTFNVKDGLTPIERFVEKIRIFGAVLKGISQLVGSYINDQDNMRKGIGKIDKDLYELLNKNGLFLFVHRVAKVLAVVGKFGIEVFKELRNWAVKLDEIFGGLTNKIFEIFGVNQKLNVDLNATGNVVDEPSIKRMSALWLNANTKSYGLMKKGAAALLAAFAAYKIYGISKGLLSKIPLLGNLFKKSSEGKPDGTQSNPLYVSLVNGDGPKAASIGSSIRSGVLAGGLNLSVFASYLKDTITAFGRFGLIKDVISKVLLSFEGLSKGAAALKAFQIIHVALAGFGLLTGVIQGVIENFGSFTNLFASTYDYLRSVDFGQIFSDLYTMAKDILADITAPLMEFGSFIYQKLLEGFSMIKPYLEVVLTPLAEAFNTLKGWVNIAGESLKTFYGWLTNLPGVGAIIKATAQSLTDPFGTFKEAGKTAVGLLGAGSDMLSSTRRNATSKNLLDKAQGGKGELMFTPQTPEDRQDYALRAVEQASGADKHRITSAYRDAMNDTVTPGQITPEEFARIFGFALDNSKIAKHTKDTATEVKAGQKTTISSRRGGC